MLANWIFSSLRRKLVAGLALGLLATSFLFLMVFIGLYRGQLQSERAKASIQVNRLLQASLENAMLKRDLPGLRDIVGRLGRQESIVSVMIINPARQVRFASDPAMLERMLLPKELGCTKCDWASLDLEKLTRFTTTPGGADILRSVNPIRNKPACLECHGLVADNPVNGILVVDQDASNVKRDALLGAAMLSGAGLFVAVLSLIGAWFFLSSAVIAPVGLLNRASRRLSSGDLDSRVEYSGRDELGELSLSFNTMAGRLQNSLNQLQDSEEFLQSLIDAMPDGVRVIDENYKVVMVNDAYCRQLRVEYGEAVGVACYEIQGRDEPCLPSLITCPFHAMPADGGPLKYIHIHQQKDGGELHVEISAACLDTVRNGASCRLIVESIRDIAQQVKYSQEQRLAELGQLATGVAHEIYNPLASVRLGLQAVLKKIEATDSRPKGTLKYLRSVDGEVDKCIEVTKRLLDLSVPPSEHVQLVSFSTIIPDIVSLLGYEAIKDNVSVTLDLGDDDLRVLATDSELRMLVLNLAQNAFHAMPDGGALGIRGVIEEGSVRITVDDTGVGIPAENIAHIFDPFFSHRADDVAGTGLGLTISKAIVTRYKGKLDVSSTVGQGTTFCIIMPAADRPDEQP